MKNRNILTSILIVFISCYSFGQALPPINVLFVGNSFTSFQSMPENFRDLAIASGKSVTIGEFTYDGGFFADHPSYGPGYESSIQLYTLIRSKTWDYVVLQDNQGNFCANSMITRDLDANIRIRDSVKANSPCATIIWFAGWGPQAGCYSTGDDMHKAINRIDTNYQHLNNLYPTKKEIIAPLGKAWSNCAINHPSIQLYNTQDYTHPSREGQFLNASVFFSTIFKEDPSGINFNGSQNGVISPTNAATLRNIAWNIVTTGYIYTNHNLGSITPSISNNGGVLTTDPGYSSYQWYLNGNAITGATSATYTPTLPGQYSVLATLNGCQKYLSFQLTVTATSVEEITDLSSISIYPNPTHNELQIQYDPLLIEKPAITLFDTYGKAIKNIKEHGRKSGNVTMDIKHLPVGIYFLHLSTKDKKTIKKIIKM